MDKDKKSFAETHPEVAKQWHPTLNGDLSPQHFTKGSIKKVWWKCDKSGDHEWESTINHRTSGTGCPCCSGQKVVPSNSLATTHPEIAKQWHPTKNGDLIPKYFTANSGKKVWWKCEKVDEHEWQDRITDVTNGKNCKDCNGRKGGKVILSKCLAATNPDLAKQWHPTKNCDLTPFNVTKKSYKKVWWKCNKGEDHEWKSAINTRVDPNWCAICAGKKVVLSNCLATITPELAKQWHPTKNGNLTPYDVTINSSKRVWWKCDKGDDHEWEVSVNNKSKGTDCPICSGQKVVPSNSLATTHPEIAKQWHPSKNGNLTPYDLTNNSNKRVWWKCDKGNDHEWKTNPNSKKGCPICSGRKVVSSNSLANTHPEIAKQWHPSKNGNLTPYNLTNNSGKKVWWKCDKGDDHEWEASPNSKLGCPVCSNQKVVKSNSLATTHPKIAKQWHPIKNGDLSPLKLSAGSNLIIWWKCDKGDDHEWKTSPAHRLRGRNCPFCTLTPQSKQELTITFEFMKLFKNIDPKGLKTRLDGRLRAIDIYIPKLNLCIEFDGAYWHKDKRDIDKIKSEMLFEEGFKLIRVREEPLKKIFDTDVISKKPYNGKQVTNDILSMILSIFELDTKLVSKIKAYQSKDGLQNEKGLEKYIDKILTEKAEKK